MKKVELLVTLRGKELWLAGTVFDYDTMPGEIAAEIAMDRGTVRVFEQVTQVPVVPPPPPPEPEVSFSEIAKDLLDADLETDLEEEEAEVEETPRFFAKHKGAGRWVVLDQETGARMNEEYLDKKAAKALTTKLNDELESGPQVVGASSEEEKPTLIVREDDD
jgi:hypothetical protein